MISWPPYPIPVNVQEKGEGFILYVKDRFIFENDEFAIVLKNGGGNNPLHHKTIYNRRKLYLRN